MNLSTKYNLRLILLLLFIFSLSLNAQSVKLKFIETSDVHGAIFPYDFIGDRQLNSSLAQIYTFVKQEREKTDQHVILLDNGDILQGQPIVYYYNFEKTDTPHVISSVMNYMNYDAGTVGNHDIETGHSVYDKINSEFNFPWMAANTIDTITREPYFSPYTIIKKDGIKIAVLGLITPSIPNWLPPVLWEGMVFEDMVLSAAKWVDIIRRDENPDILIGLFHAGVDFNYNDQSEDTPSNENASRLAAERVPGFDIVFVGHDHQSWNYTVQDPNGKDVLILGTKGYAQNAAAGTIAMDYDPNTKSWNKKITGELIEPADFKPDSLLLAKFNGSFEAVKNYVSKPIGKLHNTLSARDALFGSSAFTDLIHRIQLEISGAEISFTAPLSINSKIDAGEIYVRDMFKLYRYENMLYTMKLSGREILNYLEYSYGLWFNQMSDKSSHLLNFEYDDLGNMVFSERSKLPMLKSRYYNFDSAAGIEYEVDISKEAGSRIKILSLSTGGDFDLDKNYNVAINSYRGNGGGGHLLRGAGISKEELSSRIISSTDKDLRFYLMKWIEQKGEIDPKPLDNWKVLPEEFLLEGKKTDYKLLFGKTAEEEN